MVGTIVNTLAVIVGAACGIFVKAGLDEKYKKQAMDGVGLSVLFIGLSGALSGMLSGKNHSVLFIISIVVGAIIGQKIDIDEKLNCIGEYIQGILPKSSESSVAQGFVSATLLFCGGTMSILGALESGAQGVHSTLFAKSVLDAIVSLILASSMGIGVLLAAGSVLIYEGTLTLLAQMLERYLTSAMISEISTIGGILITGLAINILGIKQIKVANFLPAILVPIIYYAILG